MLCSGVPQNLKLFLDGLLAGLRVFEASARISGYPSHGTPAHWRRQSREAEAAGDTLSDFYFAWPSDAPPDWFHNHYALVKKRRAAMFESEQWQDFKRGRFAVVDGRLAFQHGDFGEILLRRFRNAAARTGGKSCTSSAGFGKARREGWLDFHHSRRPPGRPRLRPEGEPPIVVNAPSAIDEYIQSTYPKPRPMTPLEHDLRDRLAAGPQNPKPNAPVAILSG